MIATEYREIIYKIGALFWFILLLTYPLTKREVKVRRRVEDCYFPNKCSCSDCILRDDLDAEYEVIKPLEEEVPVEEPEPIMEETFEQKLHRENMNRIYKVIIVVGSIASIAIATKLWFN